jgi:hypothetical protein
VIQESPKDSKEEEREMSVRGWRMFRPRAFRRPTG